MKTIVKKTILFLSISIVLTPNVNQCSNYNTSLTSSISNVFKNHPIKSLLLSTGAIVAGYYYFQLKATQRAIERSIEGTGDIFMIGERKFCNIKLPNNMTRQAWYLQKMNAQEEYLKSKILTLLKITPEQYLTYEKLVIDEIQNEENNICSNQKDIIGAWFKDFSKGEICRYNGNKMENVFTITDKDLNEINTILLELGYTGKVATLELAPNSRDMLEAFSNLITIKTNPAFFEHFGPVHKFYSLRHELSHIEHKDIIFERTIKKYILSLTDASQSYDPIKLINKNITYNDLDNAYDLFMKWWTFHERRADLEALLDLKKCKAFCESIKNVQQYQGYPLSEDIESFYEKHSIVAYLKDFFDGIANDYKLANA